MSALRKGGLLTSVKGHPRPALAREPEQITLLDVYRAVEGNKPIDAVNHSGRTSYPVSQKIEKNHTIPFSVVVLGNFRRFYFPTLLIHSSELQFFPFLREFFSALFRAFFVEKIFWICYNNSTL